MTISIPNDSSSAAPARAVVVCSTKADKPTDGHENCTRSALARQIAALRKEEFAGEYNKGSRYDKPLYFVPDETLVGIDDTAALGIYGVQDLFGGVVPHAFVATKTITHGLMSREAAAPEGWSHGFAEAVRDVVLPGYSAFSFDDARLAGMRMLERGNVRMKKPSGIGGLGQCVVENKETLERELQSIGAVELASEGIVFERNLPQVATLSVGQVRLGGMLATYYGVQRLTRNNEGVDVYGGSDLVVVRGDFDALMRLSLEDHVRTAIAQARTYHVSAFSSFTGMFASRCNYDIAQGVDDDGRWQSGVLEQSWRIGGASGAEIVALAVFQEDPAVNVARASTVEIYGECKPLPPGALLIYQGEDKRVGPLTKYARLESHGDA